MNLQANIQGFIFYNEVLFGFYKSLYTKHKEFLKGMNREAVNLIDEAEAVTINFIEKKKNKV
jgi:hypothetical protein